MQLDAQDYLRLVEEANKLAFFDIEATGLRGDYNSVLIVSVKPFASKVVSFKIAQPGNDKRVVREAIECLESFDCWASYYGKGFDIPMLRTRALKWGLPDINKKHHIDLYFTLKHNLLTARKSQGHLLSFLGTEEQKMSVGADTWNEILYNFEPTMKTMQKRCESDAIGLQGLYEKTKHLIKEIKK